MTDIADDASIVIEQTVEHAIAQIPRYTGISAMECVECGEVIPGGRRVAIPGVKLCAACQSLADVRKQGVRRG